MSMLVPVLVFVCGFIAGVVAAYFLKVLKVRTAKELSEEILKTSEAEKKAAIDGIVSNIKAEFGSMSLEALSRSTEEFLKLAKEKLESERQSHANELDSKKSLIDKEISHMTSTLYDVSKLVRELEKDRQEKFGHLTSEIKNMNQRTEVLTQTTNTLKEALASTKTRGQWGERMAEDILRLAGFIENVNYHKQKSIEGIGSRPDFTFFLPKNLKLNMDVKFPLDNYVRHLEAKTDSEKEKYKNDFFKDVRLKIKELVTRDYINPEQNTVDYVVLFIPNEQIYAFIQESDQSIFDKGLESKVICCSPMTFFAVLAVIRQAVDNFSLERTSNEILSLLGGFKKQWDEFLKKMLMLGNQVETVHKTYDELVTTRRRQLDRQLDKIEELRSEKNIPAVIEEPDGRPALIDKID